MAHFYGRIQGNRGEATRMGSKASGFYANARGWDIGGSLELSHKEYNGSDIVSMALDCGSNGGGSIEVAAFSIDKDGKREVIRMATLREINDWIDSKK